MKVKWDITGKGDEAWGSDFTPYDGPTPPKGSYVCRVKRMTLGTISKQGENQGKPRISVLLEVVGGQGANGLDDPEYPYLGAPIWDGLNIIKNQTGRVNGFLHALTDGSENAKRAVETAFWPPNGPDAKKEERRGQAGGSDVHIKKIGQYVIGSPNGESLVRITTKMGKALDGSDRAEVNGYLPYTGPQPEKKTKVVDDDVIDDGNEIMDAGDFLDSVEDESVADDGVYAGVIDDEPPF